MTHNQIDYWNMVENRRHNFVLERQSQRDVDTRSGTLIELQRHNIASENLSGASIQQAERASQRSASAQKYASDNALYASKYSSDKSFEASRYASASNAATSRYVSELNAETQRYNADLNASTQRYLSDNSRFNSLVTAGQANETNRYSANLNSQTQKELGELKAEVDKRGQDIDAARAQTNNLVSLADIFKDSLFNTSAPEGTINFLALPGGR